MAYPGHNPDLFRWKKFTKSKTSSGNKVHVNDGDIDHWRKRVEMASEFAVSEALKKPRSGISSQTMDLQSTEQLQDHDDAYSEAQTLLSDWMNKKLRLELEMEDEDFIDSTENNSPIALPPPQPASLDYNNFNALYSHLAEEEESSVVNKFLQDLMERELVDNGIVEDLVLDSERDRKRRSNPSITMEARHKQVRENRAQRDMERERQHREREVRREAREEAQRREQEEERRRRQEARRQEEMVQQEMVRLRREMEKRRSLEQLARQMERERLDKKKAAKSRLVPESGPSLSSAQQQQDVERPPKLQQAEARAQMLILKCLQRHFSGWYSVLLEQRVRMGKAAALCDWKRQLRAWRAWRALVWEGREHREAEKTEEELRTENRHSKVAMESDRRRLLRRCLNDWQLWCRMERDQRELRAQQDETRRKMAALINAAATGKLNTAEPPAHEPITAQPETSDQPEITELKGYQGSRPSVADHSPTCQGDGQLGTVAPPTLAWQVTRRHVAPSAAELQRERQRGDGDSGGARSVVSRGGRFEHRHATQQQTISEQRRLLGEQQEEIARLLEEQSMMGLKPGAHRAAQLTPQSPVPAAPWMKSPTPDPQEHRAPSVPGGNSGRCSAPRKPVARRPCPHPNIMAMEERAHQRAERRREVEEIKRKKEKEILAQMKAAEEEKQREEEEEKRRAAERRREERRQDREREQERQRRLEQEQQLKAQAELHYHRTLLLRRGLLPWKRLLILSQANTQLAGDHHRQSLLRQCMLSWQQVAAQSLAQKQSSADRLNQHLLLRRSLCSWKRLKDQCGVLEERAMRFCHKHTLRRALLALLEYVTQERMVAWDCQQKAQEHSDRRVLRGCFLAWRKFPRLLREERAREARREKLRRRVAEVLPDFRSSPLDSLWGRPPL